MLGEERLIQSIRPQNKKGQRGSLAQLLSPMVKGDIRNVEEIQIKVKNKIKEGIKERNSQQGSKNRDHSEERPLSSFYHG
jgi:hypothetical protein